MVYNIERWLPSAPKLGQLKVDVVKLSFSFTDDEPK